MKEPRRPHKQVWVKVNAPVDEEVADVVEALSAFPDLCTFSSCQGYDPKTDFACVYFCCGTDRRDVTAAFTCKLAPLLCANTRGDAEIELNWQWINPDRAIATLKVQGGEEGRRRVARVLRKLAKQWHP